jgi:hypothetical protein
MPGVVERLVCGDEIHAPIALNSDGAVESL